MTKRFAGGGWIRKYWIEQVIHWDVDGSVSVQSTHQIDDSSKHTSKYQNTLQNIKIS